jgi:nucleoside triphosphate diphosphatase
MVRELRARCPWDKAQTRNTLRPYLVEEALELSEALGADDAAGIRSELGDLLLHLAFQIVLAEELGDFTGEDVADSLEDKMRRRHPHLFGLGAPEKWERLKRRERNGTMAGLVPTLPPLIKALRLQERAASVGFDWPDVQGPLSKVREELAEVEAELIGGPQSHAELQAEIGDLLFAVVNLARKSGADPMLALDGANRKFRQRFEEVEQLARERDIDVESAGLERLDELWDEVKSRRPTR